MVEEVLNELGEDGLEFLEGGGFGHDDLNIGRALIESNKDRRKRQLQRKWNSLCLKSCREHGRDTWDRSGEKCGVGWIGRKQGSRS